MAAGKVLMVALYLSSTWGIPTSLRSTESIQMGRAVGGRKVEFGRGRARYSMAFPAMRRERGENLFFRATTQRDDQGSRPAGDVVVISMEDVLIPSGSGTLYKGTTYALQGAAVPFYITSKLSRTEASRTLLSQGDFLGDFSKDSRRLVTGPSTLDVLKEIAGRTLEGTKIHFVHSDPEILTEANRIFNVEKVHNPNVALYRAAWSENIQVSDEEIENATENCYQTIGLTEFVELMKMGIIMAYGIDSHRQYALKALYRDPAV